MITAASTAEELYRFVKPATYLVKAGLCGMLFFFLHRAVSLYRTPHIFPRRLQIVGARILAAASSSTTSSHVTSGSLDFGLRVQDGVALSSVRGVCYALGAELTEHTAGQHASQVGDEVRGENLLSLFSKGWFLGYQECGSSVIKRRVCTWTTFACNPQILVREICLFFVRFSVGVCVCLYALTLKVYGLRYNKMPASHFNPTDGHTLHSHAPLPPTLSRHQSINANGGSGSNGSSTGAPGEKKSNGICNYVMATFSYAYIGGAKKQYSGGQLPTVSTNAYAAVAAMVYP